MQKFTTALLGATFVFGLHEVQKCIGRIECDYFEGGAGFRISNRLIMTAAHVLAESETGRIIFHYCEPCLPYHPRRQRCVVPTRPGIVLLREQCNSRLCNNRRVDHVYFCPMKPRVDRQSTDSRPTVDRQSTDSRPTVLRSSPVAVQTVIRPGAHTSVFSYPGGQTMTVSSRQNSSRLCKGEIPSMPFYALLCVRRRPK